MEKEQFMIQLDPAEVDELDALRIVMGVSRAEVGRRAMRGQGVRQLERDQRDRLDRLRALAGRAGMSIEGFTRTQCRARKVVPSLEVLEALQRERDGNAASASASAPLTV